jgi:hypothetical protein
VPPEPSQPGWLGDDEDFSDCLTAGQVAGLNRQDWELCCPDPDDPRYADDEDGPPPGWLALPAAEQARLLAEEEQRAEDEQRADGGVPKVFGAGLTRR